MPKTLKEKIIDIIIKKELHFHFVRSSGHGGQNVNKRNTKAQLYFNIENTIHLTDKQKAKLVKLA